MDEKSGRANILQPVQLLGGIYIHQRSGGNLPQELVTFVGADHAAAALIAFNFQKLRKKAGGKETGISPVALMAQRHDVIRMTFVKS